MCHLRPGLAGSAVRVPAWGRAAPHPSVPAPARISTNPDVSTRQAAGSRRPSAALAAADRLPAQTRPATRPDLGFAVLLPAARAVRDELVRDGQALTRDTLAVRLRQQGYQVRNSRLTLVLRALRDDPASHPAPAPGSQRPRETNSAARGHSLIGVTLPGKERHAR